MNFRDQIRENLRILSPTIRISKNGIRMVKKMYVILCKEIIQHVNNFDELHNSLEMIIPNLLFGKCKELGNYAIACFEGEDGVVLLNNYHVLDILRNIAPNMHINSKCIIYLSVILDCLTAEILEMVSIKCSKRIITLKPILFENLDILQSTIDKLHNSLDQNEIRQKKDEMIIIFNETNRMLLTYLPYGEF
jgi:hypothetical protein